MTDDKPLHVTNPEQWLEETVIKADEDCLVCIVFFRGSWCKYDKYYLRKLGQFITKKQKDEKVKLIAWTSEGAAGAQKANEEWGLVKELGYAMVLGDDTNALAEYLKEDEILPNIAIVSAEEAKVQNLIPPGTHANGIVMAGQVWWAHHGTPVFEWASKFEEPTLGGPNRPEPNFVWEEVLKRKHALDIGNAIMPVHGDSIKMCTNDFDVNAANCSVL